MNSILLRTWHASRPALKRPRWWVASVLRRALTSTTFVAITGSNGKTTATRYLAAILAAQAPTQWTRLNRNSQAGITETIAFCKPWKTRYAVFEIGFGKAGSIARLASLVRPHIAVELSVHLEHRSALRELEAVAREKATLLEALPEGGVAVLNMDDPWVAQMPVPPGRRVIRVGASRDNDFRYEDVSSGWPQNLRFTVVAGDRRQLIKTRLLGTHWVGPLLACIAVARHLGVPLEEIARVIEEVPPYPARMQAVRLPGGAVVLRDEFKGSRHTIEAAFEEIRKASAGRKFLVFCDEAESPRKPRERLARVGREAAEIFDCALFVGERAHHGVAGAVKAGMGNDRARAFADYTGAADFLRGRLKPDDVVLLKASRDNQLTRVFYSLIGEVRCTVSRCRRTMVCDDCRDFANPELVRLANDELTVRAG